MSVQEIVVKDIRDVPTTDEALDCLRRCGYAGGRRNPPRAMAANDLYAAMVSAWRLAGKAAARRAGFKMPRAGSTASFTFYGCYERCESSTGMLVAKWLLDGFFDYLDPGRGHWHDACVNSLTLLYEPLQTGHGRAIVADIGDWIDIHG